MDKGTEQDNSLCEFSWLFARLTFFFSWTSSCIVSVLCLPQANLNKTVLVSRNEEPNRKTTQIKQANKLIPFLCFFSWWNSMPSDQRWALRVCAIIFLVWSDHLRSLTLFSSEGVTHTCSTSIISFSTRRLMWITLPGKKTRPWQGDARIHLPRGWMSILGFRSGVGKLDGNEVYVYIQGCP